MLGNRELQILKYFSMSNHEVCLQDLVDLLGISERQLSYSLSKINDELLLKKREKIKRLRDGRFQVNFDDIQQLYYQESSNMTSTDKQADFYISPVYRPLFLFLLLVAGTGKIRRSEVQEFLGVSKNTAIQDIKNVAELVRERGLLLPYHQIFGYLIEGDHDVQRRILVEYINELVLDNASVGLLERLFSHQKPKILKLISSFERSFSLRFSDSAFSKLYFSLGIYERFVTRQSAQCNVSSVYKSPLRKEDEFVFVSRLVKELGLSFRLDTDIEWVTLLFLSSNTILNEAKTENQKLYVTVDEMVTIFEKQSGIYFKDRELLIKKLFFHLKPATYRLRYNIPLSDADYYKITDSDLQNKTIYSILSSCLQPFEDYLGKVIPQNEVELISYYFGSELVKISSQSEEVSKLRAGVVCSNGMVVAKIMFQTLGTLFPEMTFVTTCSQRDFPQYEQEFDVVFTTSPLNTTLPYYVIPSVLNQDERRNLRQRVSMDFKIDNFDQKTKDILDMVKQHADIRDIYELGIALENIIQKESRSTGYSSHKYLQSYLDPTRVLSTTEQLSWQEGLNRLGAIFVTQGLVTTNYMSAVERQMGEEDSYYILGGTVAIPHASPEDGVLKEGCAILVSELPIVFPGNREVHFVVLLALLDNKNHLGALNQIMHLSRSADLQKRLLNQIGSPQLFETLVSIPQKD